MVELELMIEWGVTPAQFDNVPVITLSKIFEYRAAKAEGQERYQAQQNKQ